MGSTDPWSLDGYPLILGWIFIDPWVAFHWSPDLWIGTTDPLILWWISTDPLMGSTDPLIFELDQLIPDPWVDIYWSNNSLIYFFGYMLSLYPWVFNFYCSCFFLQVFNIWFWWFRRWVLIQSLLKLVISPYIQYLKVLLSCQDAETIWVKHSAEETSSHYSRDHSLYDHRSKSDHSKDIYIYFCAEISFHFIRNFSRDNLDSCSFQSWVTKEAQEGGA